MTRDNRGARPNPIKTASPTLRSLMELADLNGASHAAISEATGYSTQSLSSWRSGHHAPNILAVEEIAAALGYHIELVRL